MGLGVLLAPLFLLLALPGKGASGGGFGALKLFLVLVLLAIWALFVVMMNLGELSLVRQSNVGLWQRACSLASIPWIAIVSVWLESTMKKAG